MPHARHYDSVVNLGIGSTLELRDAADASGVVENINVLLSDFHGTRNRRPYRGRILRAWAVTHALAYRPSARLCG
jgi:hypothetical protein